MNLLVLGFIIWYSGLIQNAFLKKKDMTFVFLGAIIFLYGFILLL